MVLVLTALGNPRSLSKYNRRGNKELGTGKRCGLPEGVSPVELAKKKAPVRNILYAGHKGASVVQRQGRVPGAERAGGRMLIKQGVSLGYQMCLNDNPNCFLNKEC